MKKILVLPTVIILALVMSFTSAFAGINPMYASPLTVNLNISDLGTGYWRYNFSFNNTDTSEIWFFQVFTTNSTYNQSGSFELVLPHTNPIDNLFPEYDARNIDPTLNYEQGMWYANFPVLAVGDSATYSFESPDYMDKFLYSYETMASGYTQTNGTGQVAAIGYATVVPEPISYLLFISGGALLAGRRFLRRKA